MGGTTGLRMLGLVAGDGVPSLQLLRTAASALDVQIERDLAPSWGVQARVEVFRTLQHVPSNYWPILVRGDARLHVDGYHGVRRGRPFAIVALNKRWTVTCSHEMIEMLVNPFRRRRVPGPAPIAGRGEVEYLVEICSPCQGVGGGSLTWREVRSGCWWQLERQTGVPHLHALGRRLTWLRAPADAVLGAPAVRSRRTADGGGTRGEEA